MADDEWITPEKIYRLKDDIWHFTVDACANELNAKTDRFFDLEVDALQGEFWDERVWCNPPYSNPASFIRLAARTAQTQRALWVMLLPPIVDTKAFHECIWDEERWQPRPGVDLNFHPGRIHFEAPPGKPKKDNPVAGNVWVVFHPNLEQTVEVRQPLAAAPIAQRSGSIAGLVRKSRFDTRPRHTNVAEIAKEISWQRLHMK